ncbi:MAG: peptidoglycan DD-metalloendopeptidase family protein [Propionibacteriales bacterium]|nr:peptidoglycan DD-metalloendopeptidase family protein [Propionibacteriales bacterium]
MTAISLASLLAVGVMNSSPSNADNHHRLPSREHRLETRIGSQQADLDEISTRLLDAQASLATAVDDLATARGSLADLRAQVRTATLVDRRTQVRLDQAVVRLRDARADIVHGRRQVQARRSDLTGYAVSSYQAGGLDVYALGMTFDAGTTQQTVDGLQDVDAALNKQAADLQELQAMQVLLTLTEDRVQATRDDVAQRRQQAADNLTLKRTLESQAEAAEAEVQSRVETLRVGRQQLAAAKREELDRLNDLETERQRVEERLRAVAERRARQHDRAIGAASVTNIATRIPATVSAAPTSPSTGSSDGGFLSDPVADSYVTSPYGMRMHPILHVWKLHDGTDFQADCGSPVYAAADGTVAEEYFNTGYGNRILIDHGYLKGVSLATSYNHLTSFVASVGQHVSRGQLIAYAGTTGYSTGCHLHFMVYVNGSTVDPMSWL